MACLRLVGTWQEMVCFIGRRHAGGVASCLVCARTMSGKNVGVEVKLGLNVVTRQCGLMTTVCELGDVALVTMKACMIFRGLDMSWLCNLIGVDC